LGSSGPRRPSEEVVKIMSDILLMLFTFHNQHRWKKIIFNIKSAYLMATTYIEGLDSLSVQIAAHLFNSAHIS